jgi:TatD DNase family protein
MNFIDTHTHLHIEDFDGDREAVIRRAKDAGVVQMITLGTDLSSSLKALEVAGLYPAVFAAIGIHPGEAHLAKTEDDSKIKELAIKAPKVVAIGETGLDFYWDKTFYQAQYDNFRRMLNLAKELVLPVVIHNRSAHREMEWFFQEENFDSVNGVMHCFSGELIDAKFYLEMGLHISFTADITRKSFHRLEMLEYIPLDRVMIETDSPYIVPAQVNAKRNEPANVVYVAQKLAEVHRKPLEEIARVTTENARRLFRLPG